jgi:hypothetical protein
MTGVSCSSDVRVEPPPAIEASTKFPAISPLIPQQPECPPGSLCPCIHSRVRPYLMVCEPKACTVVLQVLSQQIVPLRLSLVVPISTGSTNVFPPSLQVTTALPMYDGNQFYILQHHPDWRNVSMGKGVRCGRWHSAAQVRLHLTR